MRGSRSSLPIYRIVHLRPEHSAAVHEVVCFANDYPVGTRGCIDESELKEMLSRFPDGQFVAVANLAGHNRVVGVAVAMRTDYAPSSPPLSWRDMIGDLGISAHNPEGRWLYGVEKAVHPDFQGLGIGSALYRAQFGLVEKLNLAGMYAGGMLKGYKTYKHEMSVREYAGRVMRGELFDPTVSVQMKRGFRPCTVIENYAWDFEAAHTGVLIVWEPPPRDPRSRARYEDSGVYP